MLLAIDEAKVKESLAISGTPAYVVTASHLVAAPLPPFPTPLLSIGGTVTLDTPRVNLDTREYLLSLRRQIEESGVPLKNVDELTKEIDEMRGRSR